MRHSRHASLPITLSIALLFTFVAFIWPLEANAGTCDNLYIVVPPKNEQNGISDGGVFYLYEKMNMHTGKYPPKGYLPSGTLVWNQENPIPYINHHKYSRQEIREDNHGNVENLYFISEFGDFGYVRAHFLRNIKDYVEEKGLAFECHKNFGFIVPIGAKDGEEVILYQLTEGEPPKQITQFTRSFPLLVAHRRNEQILWTYKINGEKVTNNYLIVEFSQNGNKQTAYIRDEEGERNRTYRLSWIADNPRPIEHDTELSGFRKFVLINDSCKTSQLIKKATGLIQDKISISQYKISRSKSTNIKNLFNKNIYKRDTIECKKISDKFFDHYLSEIHFSFEYKNSEYYMDILLRDITNSDLNNHFKKVEGIYAAGVPVDRVPEVGMIAFGDSPLDYFTLYRMVHQWLGEEVNKIKTPDDQSRSRLMHFLVNKIIYAPSKNDR